MPNVDEQFEEIAAETVRKAEAVSCSKQDFVNGLDVVIEELRDRKSMMESEIRSDDKDDADVVGYCRHGRMQIVCTFCSIGVG